MPATTPYKDRFVDRVILEPSGCWRWTQPRQNGYGYLSVNNREKLAHRLAYEWFKEPIAEGLELDHLCRNPACVNPDHLEAVTHAENCRRGQAGQHLRAKTHCKHGHEFSGSNTFWDHRGYRQCQTCRRVSWTRQNQRQNQKRKQRETL